MRKRFQSHPGVPVPDRLLTFAYGAESFRKDLNELLDLSEAQLEALSREISSPAASFPESWDELTLLGINAGIDSQVLRNCLPSLRYLLARWKTSKSSLTEVLEDLRGAGLSSERSDKADLLLSPLEVARDKLFEETLKSRALVKGAPTIDDISLIWDLRPVFAAQAYSEESEDQDVIEWVSHVNVLIVEINASRSDGQQESTTLQLSEKDFAQLEKALGRARKQLETLKAKLSQSV